MKKLLFGYVVAMAAALLFLPNAHAAPFSLVSSGQWTAATPDPLGNPNTLEGLGTNDLKWGIPVPADASKSGYVFVGFNENIPTEAALIGAPHQVGTLVHNNFPIEQNPGAINSATLGFSLDIDGNNIAIPLLFQHAETDNFTDPCAILGGAPPAGGCRDVVTLPGAGFLGNLVLDGVEYAVELLGFIQNGSVVSQFVTNEMANNSAGLFVSFSRVAVPEPALPLVLGLGLLAATTAFRRRPN